MTQIFLLAGAPAVGKSSTARALAARFPRGMHIPVDDLRHMVVSGLVEPGEWTPDLVEQLRLARRSAAQMALAYRAAGFVVAMDDFWDPVSLLAEYEALFRQPGVHKVLLYPSQRAAEARNQGREGMGEGSAYIAAGIRSVYEHLGSMIYDLERQGWLVVDTSNLSIAATIDHILSGME